MPTVFKDQPKADGSKTGGRGTTGSEVRAMTGFGRVRIYKPVLDLGFYLEQVESHGEKEQTRE